MKLRLTQHQRDVAEWVFGPVLILAYAVGCLWGVPALVAVFGG